MSRRLVPGLAALALLATAAPAHAFSPTVYPTASGPAMPGTTRVVDIWKLVGTSPANSSAIQIAPRWVLSSDHSSVAVGTEFRNSYGAATVLEQYRPTIGYPTGIDLTLEYLSAPIDVPGPFPKLLDGTTANGLDTSLPGWLLSAGFGRNGTTPPDWTTPTVAWSTPYGQNAPDSAAHPTPLGGDSGGGLFWFPTATSAPVLAGVIGSGEQRPSLGSQEALGGADPLTGERVRDFMDAAFAARAGEPGGTPPSYTTITEQAGPLTALRPSGPGLTYADMTGATKVRVKWILPGNSGVPQTGFRVYFNGVLKATVGPTTSTVTVTGLKWLTKYTVHVAGYNANGESPSGLPEHTFTTTTIL